MKTWIAMLALCCAAPLALAQGPVVIKFSHVVAADTPKGKGALRFKELAEQRSGGRVKVEVYGYIGYAVIVNAKFWNGLPPDLRTVLEGAMRDATRHANVIAQQENDHALAAIKASGKTEIIVLDEKQKDAWRKAMQPVYKDMEGRVGKDLIASIQKAS